MYFPGPDDKCNTPYKVKRQIKISTYLTLSVTCTILKTSIQRVREELSIILRGYMGKTRNVQTLTRKKGQVCEMVI